MIQILYLLLGLGLIFLAAELFTNAIEWFGKHLNLGHGAVGSVFAAIGTALPESLVPLVAFMRHQKGDSETGVGAILGAPMMLSTLAMFMTGLAVLIYARQGRRSKTIHADYKVVGRDLRWFFIVYLMAFGAAFIPLREGKLAVGAVLLVCYAWYVRSALLCSDCTHEEGEMRPLRFSLKPGRPRMRIVVIQLVCAVTVLLTGARIFVVNIEQLSHLLRISPLILSVIITPIATELPEVFNSVTWIRHKKDTLALGNITGAMVFQSSVLPALGIMCTGWGIKELGPAGIGSIVVALLASAVLGGEMMFRKRLSPYVLLFGTALYALFPIYFFGILHGKP